MKKRVVRRLPGGRYLNIDGRVYQYAVPLSVLARVCGRTTNAFAKRAKALGAEASMEAGRAVWVLKLHLAQELLVRYGALPKPR